ncbi:efflux RND transporter permease subunit [Hugenholtzia roseola]|uniref:efflux RND transporter permease subunit n=1 Tax=Hugenholtzia roseola TaxID=1002 RepID=UPI00041461E3|nr:efflux RND transporter permease subunit [Hugenholtzia roseola]
MSEKQPQLKTFGLSTFSLSNATSVFILTAIIVVAGLMAYIGMPKEQFPEIKMPTVYVQTVYPGNSPVDIENLISRPIEKELKSLKGVKKITSTSVQDASAIVVEFNEDVQISKAVTDTKDAVDKSKKDLPNDLDTEPTVMELDLSEIPIVEINLSGDFEISKLKEYAEYLQDEMEALPEISEVDITGDLEREIQINANLHEMAARKVAFSDIENAIASENLTASGGEILNSGYRRSLRVDGEFSKVKEIETIIVKSENADAVYLKDVAKVSDNYVERKSIARLAKGDEMQQDSKPVISLKVKKRSGANLISAAEQIALILEKAQKERFPSGLKIVSTNDQSENIKKQIANLENNIISGVLLVVGVLLFFLGLRNASLVGVAIPLSMFLSFLVLNMMGVTINMIVLFALILALGMLVDNAIVVVENTYRLMEQGYTPFEAAKYGVGEVAIPIIASTATTLAAFVPLAFWGGILGEFMKYLPITLIIVLASSLFVGLVINPVFAKAFMRTSSKGTKKTINKGILVSSLVAMGLALPLYFINDTYTVPNLLMTYALIALGNVYVLSPLAHAFQDKVLTVVEGLYLRLLSFALKGRTPYFLFVSMFFLLFGSIFLVGLRQPKVELFPSNEPLFVYMYMEAPLGTDIYTMDAKAKEVEKIIYQTLEPYKGIIKSVITNVGAGSGDPNQAMGSAGGATPNKARIAVAFVDFELRGEVATSDVMKKLAESVKNVSGITIKTEKNREGPPVGKPINIEVTGDDYTKLVEVSENIKAFIDREGIAGIDNLELDAETGKPELLLTIDRDKARLYGLSTFTIATTLRTAIYGKEVSKFKDKDEDYPIQLRLEEKYRYNLSTLMNQVITFRDNRGQYRQIPISAVATVDYSSSFGSIKRKDLKRMIAIGSNVVEGYNANEIVEQIKTLLATYPMPEGYQWKFTGEQEEQQKSFLFLRNALLIAVSAIFLLLVMQFNSLVKPFIVMTSVLLSTIGVFLGLAIFNMNFVIIMTGIGIISLAGVVVNNAIVLIDYTDSVRQRKREERGLEEGEFLSDADLIEVLVEGGYTRLRPVLLTAITTVLGLVPLAIGLNIDFFKFYASFDPDIYMGGDNAIFWGPMAWTVIFGLVFATFLTLVIVPVMYLLADKLARLFAPKSKPFVVQTPEVEPKNPNTEPRKEPIA